MLVALDILTDHFTVFVPYGLPTKLLFADLIAVFIQQDEEVLRALGHTGHIRNSDGLAGVLSLLHGHDTVLPSGLFHDEGVSAGHISVVILADGVADLVGTCLGEGGYGVGGLRLTVGIHPAEGDLRAGGSALGNGSRDMCLTVIGSILVGGHIVAGDSALGDLHGDAAGGRIIVGLADAVVHGSLHHIGETGSGGAPSLVIRAVLHLRAVNSGNGGSRCHAVIHLLHARSDHIQCRSGSVIDGVGVSAGHISIVVLADGVADGSNYISRTKLSDMERVSNHVKEKYGYNTGSWTDFPADESNIKFLARIDWNIARNHKLAVRYNYTKNQYWNAPNGNSNDASFRYRAADRMSEMSMAFANSMYSMDNVVHSFSADWNARFGNNISNQLLVTYTSIKDMRGTNSDIFPFVDILGGYEVNSDGTITQDPTPYMSLGYELFTYNNGVNNKILTVNDNFTYNLGAHKLMAGLSFEYQMANNSYMRNGTGFYRYRSVDDFINGAAPESVAFTIGYNGETNPAAQVRFNQYGLYLQDEWNINKNFKLNYGVRFDLLAFNEDDIMTNGEILAVDYGGRHIDTGKWPGNKVNVNPRVGFNWDILGNKSLVLRGGTGLFTGRLPLVFFTNMPTNSGMVQNMVTIKTKYSGYVCDATPTEALAKFAGGMITDVNEMAKIAGAKTTIAPGEGAFQSTPCGIDPDFKMPQVWKSSIAVDYQLPVSFPFTVTGEFMYTKNVNAVKLDNYNVKPVDETWERFAGSDNRVIYPDNFVYNDNINTACVLTNTSKGYGYTANITLNARPVKGLNLMAAYTRTESKEVSGMPGSNATSAWNGLYTINGPNNATVMRSQYVIPDRIIASVGYDLHETTHLNLFYTCYSPYGYSYYMTNDMNGDGISTDLIYIPKDENDIIFAGDNAAQDAADFWAFVNQDSYLKNHKGEYAEAYGARAPFVHRFDFRIAQDIKFRIGKTNHKIELSFDFMNIGNLFNSHWGVAKNMSACNNGAILNYAGQNAEGKPTFTLYRDKNGNAPAKTWEYNRATSQCWQLQFGARYTF